LRTALVLDIVAASLPLREAVTFVEELKPTDAREKATTY